MSLDIAVVVALILAQGMLAGAEVTAMALSRPQLHELLSRHPRAARQVQQARDAPAPFATTVQILVSALGVAVGACGMALWGEPLRGMWAAAQAPFAAHAMGLAVVTVVAGVSLLSIVLGDAVPIALARRDAARSAAIFAPAIGCINFLARPLAQLTTRAACLHGPHEQDAPLPALHAPPMLQQLVDEAQKKGLVHPQAADIAMRALSFGDLTAADVMVPRQRVQALAVQAQPEEIRRVLLEEGHSCVPVYDGTLDQVVGILVAKDVLALAWERELIVLEDLLQPPYFAPEMMRAADLLKELQRRRMHFAVAVDELGGTAGIVTIEDLLEELVGDIYGEHDADSPQPIRRESEATVLVQGHVPLRELNRELHIALSEGDTFSTLGGLCISLAGRIPEPGQKLAGDDGTTMEVVEASARRVRLVRVHHRAGFGAGLRPS